MQNIVDICNFFWYNVDNKRNLRGKVSERIFNAW